MAALASLFPWLVGLTTLVLLVVVLRLDRRISRGSQSAGPREVKRPTPTGLQKTPWELKAIDDQVKAGAGGRARTDLVNTINRLTKAAGIDDPRLVLPPNAPNQSVQWVINELESRLELNPINGHFVPDQAGPASPSDDASR